MEFGKLKDNLKEKVTNVTDFIGDLKDEGKEKFVNYINGLSDIIPIIATAGYRLKGIDIDVAIPPGVNMLFEKIKDVPKEEIDAIMEANKDKELLRSIVKALEMADDFHNKLKMGDLRFTSVNVNLSLPPKVTMKFIKP
jgi:hypothetical protein